MLPRVSKLDLRGVPDKLDRYQKLHWETIIVFIKYYLNVEVTEEAQRKYDRNLVIGSLNRNKIILLQHLWKLINISFISHAQLRAFLNIFPLVKSMIQKSLDYYRGPYTPPYLNKITHWKLIASVWAEKMEGPLNFLFTPTKTKEVRQKPTVL